MKPKSPGPLAVAVGAAAATGLLYMVVVSNWAQYSPLDDARALVAEATSVHAAEPPPPPRAGPSPEEILLTLPCFGCHSRERFLDESRFSHRAHEAAGHCHVCHAFSPHFEVTVRKEHCGTCHPP